MPTTVKVLGQVNPLSNAMTGLYTVPSGTGATISSLTVCNQSASNITFRVAIRVLGAALSAKQYLYYDEPIKPKKTFIATIGATLNAGDMLDVFSSDGYTSFQAFGAEVT